jgi:predicted phage gp36 major capsid-like protein
VTGSLNLLNHPGLARQQRVFHRWWSSLAGLVVGILLAWVWQHGLAIETAQLHQEQSRLQEALRARQQQAQEADREQNRLRWQAEQAGQLQQISEHQQAWVRLHESLQEEARDRGLRLVRLQSEAEKIELHGAMQSVDAVSEVRQSLSAQWPHPLGLTSMTVGPAGEVNFVWQTQWPHAQAVLTVPPSRTKEARP